MKSISVYFYYIDVTAAQLRGEKRAFNINDFISEFNLMLESLIAQNLLERKHDFSTDEKVIWLDSCESKQIGNYNMVFKSAKYNHIRTIIDTEIMQEKGAIKTKSDGDEEQTHLSIRYAEGQDRFICIHESNYYGVAIGRIIRYFNEKLSDFQQENDRDVRWSLQTEIMPCESFLEELQKMRKISLLTVTVEKTKLSNDFKALAGRDDVRETVDIVIRKVKRNIDIPKNLVSAYYNEMQNDEKIKRVIAEGKNDSGYVRIDTELIKMKKGLQVETTPTNEVLSSSFFDRADELLNIIKQ